jgi:L-ascorbate metabolism protein UlaG (beta-lactamase superfamily)
MGQSDDHAFVELAQQRRKSDHWDGKRFFNPGVPPQRFTEAMRWMLHRERGPWRKKISSVPGPAPRARVEGDELVVTLVNHSTVLLQTHGVNILTDPVWSERVSPLQFMGPRRHRAPGFAMDQLPQIDVLLISHNHYDHLDAPTLKKLARQQKPAVFCPLGVAPLLRKLGFERVQQMDWWEHGEWKQGTAYCVPAQHFAARTPFDRNRTLWCGWVVELAGERLYFAGDTGYAKLFEEVAERFAPLRLALLPIGAFRPESFMGPIHMTPEQALAAHQTLGATSSVATHYGTFSLADDGEMEPVERLQAAKRELVGDAESVSATRAVAERFLVLQEGQPSSLP